MKIVFTLEEFKQAVLREKKHAEVWITENLTEAFPEINLSFFSHPKLNGRYMKIENQEVWSDFLGSRCSYMEFVKQMPFTLDIKEAEPEPDYTVYTCCEKCGHKQPSPYQPARA